MTTDRLLDAMAQAMVIYVRDELAPVMARIEAIEGRQAKSVGPPPLGLPAKPRIRVAGISRPWP
jgi:hypothetical protein